MKKILCGLLILTISISILIGCDNEVEEEVVGGTDPTVLVIEDMPPIIKNVVNIMQWFGQGGESDGILSFKGNMKFDAYYDDHYMYVIYFRDTDLIGHFGIPYGDNGYGELQELERLVEVDDAEGSSFLPL